MLEFLEILSLCCHMRCVSRNIVLAWSKFLIVILSRPNLRSTNNLLTRIMLKKCIDSQRDKLEWSPNNMDYEPCQGLSGLTLIMLTYWHSLCACHWPVWTQACPGMWPPIWSRLCQRALGGMCPVAEGHVPDALTKNVLIKSLWLPACSTRVINLKDLLLFPAEALLLRQMVQNGIKWACKAHHIRTVESVDTVPVDLYRRMQK